jgi:hypothetical protein
MVRLIESIIGALLDHRRGRCRRLEAQRTRPKLLIFRYDPWCVTFVAQVLLAPKGGMPDMAMEPRAKLANADGMSIPAPEDPVRAAAGKTE